ncbi:MAG: squalene synthase HpnC [Solirubrobacteraceae bacterium]
MSATASAPKYEAVMAQAPEENFPVASRFLPRGQRRQLLAVYGVARLIDDVGDEALDTGPTDSTIGTPTRDRGELLNWLDAELDRVFTGQVPDHPAMRSLAAVIKRDPLPERPFRSLVQANRQDQTVTRYETFEQLLGYCRLSAAPVGELVLHVFGAATGERLAQSESICAGLQVVEHIQDVAEDYSRGRVYMPQADMERLGCPEGDLGAATASPALRELLSFESARARTLLDAGAPLARTLPARPRLALASFVAGGRAALDAVARASYDVCLHPAPARSGRSFARAFARAVMGK